MNSKRLAEATTFATIAHKNDNRKGTNIPYVSHAIEAGLIAMTMTTDEDVIIAAFLHDIVEDTPYELSDIEERFGKRVAQLVAYESEDKMKQLPPSTSWKIRKQATIDGLKEAPLEAQIICLSDKLSNIRLSVLTHKEKGDAMWEVFNQKDKKEQEWYYREIYRNLLELKETEAYREYVSLCDVVFGSQETPKNLGTD